MTMEKAWEKYNKSRRTMLAYNGGTCNKHDFKAGYEAALADTLNFNGDERAALRIQSMADELEKSRQ